MKKSGAIRKLISARDVFLLFRECFITRCLFFCNAVSTPFLLLWWKSHNGPYWLLYFLSVYPPLAFVIAEQENMPYRGAMLSLQDFFPLIIWNAVGSRGAFRRKGARSLMGPATRKSVCVCLEGGGRGGGGDTTCQITRSAPCMWKVSTASETNWGKRVSYAVWSSRAQLYACSARPVHPNSAAPNFAEQ